MSVIEAKVKKIPSFGDANQNYEKNFTNRNWNRNQNFLKINTETNHDFGLNPK